MDNIRKRLHSLHKAEDMPDILPHHDTFDWISWPDDASSGSTQALVIGKINDRVIIAHLAQKANKAPEVHYCSGTLTTNDRTQRTMAKRTLTQNDVVKMELYAPFKCNADTAKSQKRQFSTVIKWYFMAKGLLDNAVDGDLSDWCRSFYRALKKIDPEWEKKSRKYWNSPRKSAYARQLRIDTSPSNSASESSEAEKSQNATQVINSYGLRSTRRKTNGDTMAGASSAPHQLQELEVVSSLPEDQLQQFETVASSPVHLQDPEIVARSPDQSQDPDLVEIGSARPDHALVRTYLSEHNVLYMLGNMPKVSDVEFLKGNLTSTSLAKKLYIGKTLDRKDDIYASLDIGLKPDYYVVCYATSKGKKGPELRRNLMNHELVHPFNKTYPKDSSPPIHDHKRLSTIIKWYFIAAGLAKLQMLQPDRFYEDFRSTLAYIADRLGPGAERAPPSERTAAITSNGPTSTQPHGRTYSATDMPAPATRTPRRDDNQAKSTPTVASCSTTPRITPRGKKRTAEQATFDVIHEVASQERALAAQLNKIDAELETVHMKKDNFHEQQPIKEKRLKRQRADEVLRQKEKDWEEEIARLRKQWAEEVVTKSNKQVEDEIALETQNFNDQWEMEEDGLLSKRNAIDDERKALLQKLRRQMKDAGDD